MISGPVVAALHSLEAFAVSPHDLAGDIWGTWRAQVQRRLQQTQWEAVYEGQPAYVACWGCGLVAPQKLVDFQCEECGGLGGLRLGVPPGEAFEECDLAEQGLRAVLQGWSVPVRREALQQICEMIGELRSTKETRRSTWVSLLLLIARTTVLLHSEQDQNVQSMDRYVEMQRGSSQWILKGAPCAICGKFKALQTVVLKSAEQE